MMTLVLLLFTQYFSFAANAEDIKLLSGALTIEDAYRIRIDQSGGREVIRFSRDGNYVYRLGPNNVFGIDINSESSGMIVLEDNFIPVSAWLENMVWAPEDNGWLILVGNVDARTEPVIYKVDSDFKNPRPYLALNLIDPEVNEGPVTMEIFNHSSDTGLHVVGYGNAFFNKLIFYSAAGESPQVLRHDTLRTRIQSFEFSSNGKMALAVTEDEVRFYTVNGNEIMLKRVYSLPPEDLTIFPQVVYNEQTDEFIFLSKDSIYAVRYESGNPQMKRDILINQDRGDEAFWGPIALSQSTGVLALTHVLGVGFYDLNSGEEVTFISGQEDYNFFYGNFNSHSVTVSPDEKTFVFNGLREIGVLKTR